MGGSDFSGAQTAEVVAALRRGVSGSFSQEAALELLIAHGWWLRRPEFLSDLVDGRSSDGDTRGGRSRIRWSGVEEFLVQRGAVGSRVDRAVLRCATSVADRSSPGALGQLVGELDIRSTVLLLQAIAHRAGWHERGMAYVVTGVITDRAPTMPSQPQISAVPAPRSAT